MWYHSKYNGYGYLFHRLHEQRRERICYNHWLGGNPFGELIKCIKIYHKGLFLLITPQLDKDVDK